jgi:hypothetical protein
MLRSVHLSDVAYSNRLTRSAIELYLERFVLIPFNAGSRTYGKSRGPCGFA